MQMLLPEDMKNKKAPPNQERAFLFMPLAGLEPARFPA